jgi:tight adherence protein C
MEIALIALVFLATLALALGLFSTLSGRSVRRRLARLSEGGSATASGTAPVGESLLAGDDQGLLLRALGRLGRRSEQKTTGSSPLQQRLVQAGFRRPGAIPVYYGSRVALALAVPLCLLLLPAAWGLGEVRLIALLCAVSGLGWVLPSWWVDRRKASRQLRIERTLPDALDLMVVCVEAGFGINASLARVAQEFAASNPVFASELELVTLETRAGKSSTEALRGLADRTGVAEVSSLVALLVQTERFGTSVADALRVHAESMRVRRMQRAEERAEKAPLKMIFPTLLIFLAVLLIILAPAVVQFIGLFERG